MVVEVHSYFLEERIRVYNHYDILDPAGSSTNNHLYLVFVKRQLGLEHKPKNPSIYEHRAVVDISNQLAAIR